MNSISHSPRRSNGRKHRGRQPRRIVDLRSIAIDTSPNLIAIAVLWFLVLLLGGSSRPDVGQIILLRPVAILVLAYGLWTVKRGDLWRYRYLVFMAALVTGVTVLHLVPLPPGVWHSLPGRDLIVGIDREMGLEHIWRPLAMAPSFAWNALFSLSVPLAFLLNGVQLSERDLARAGSLIILGAILSALLAFFQLLGTPNGWLYPYTTRLTRPEALGFFANRNHQALLLAAMFPLLAASAAKRSESSRRNRRRLWLALGVGVFLILLLIVNGSRAGLVVGLIGCLSAPLIYRSGRVERSSTPRVKLLSSLAFSAVGILVLVGISIVTGRSVAIERALNSLSEEDQRYVSWSIILDNFERFLPWGSGVGSYQPVFQTFEPRDELTDLYSNHAHNEWLEVLLTLGMPGAILLVTACAGFLWALMRHLRCRERGELAAYRAAGLVILLMVSVASAVDYPLRTAIIAGLFVMACLWAGLGCRAAENKG